MSKPENLIVNQTPLPKSTWPHYASVAVGCVTILITLANSIIGSIKSQIWLQPILAGFAGYLFADLVTGIYHWAIDNYGNASTPIFGSQILSFQRHHKWPKMITKNEVINNLHVQARVITYMLLPLNLIWHGQPVIMGFVGMAGGCMMFSLQIHAWAHGTKAELPRIVAALQDIGVLISPSHHAGHHQSLHNIKYCSVNGFWNWFLDELKVFQALEMMVFNNLGIQPRSWTEPEATPAT